MEQNHILSFLKTFEFLYLAFTTVNDHLDICKEEFSHLIWVQGSNYKPSHLFKQSDQFVVATPFYFSSH